MVAIYGWRHDGRGWGPVAGTFDEKGRMVVAIINRICIFAITYFTDKSEFRQTDEYEKADRLSAMGISADGDCGTGDAL